MFSVVQSEISCVRILRLVLQHVPAVLLTKGRAQESLRELGRLAWTVQDVRARDAAVRVCDYMRVI